MTDDEQTLPLVVGLPNAKNFPSGTTMTITRVGDDVVVSEGWMAVKRGPGIFMVKPSLHRLEA